MTINVQGVNELYTYGELFDNAIAAGATVAEILGEAAEEVDAEKRAESRDLAHLVLEGGLIFATLALAKATRDGFDGPARPKLRGL